MGRVWRATDVVLHREVAIKELVPPPGLTPEERQEMRERSLREARAIARLNNINVVRVFDVLRTDADPWIVMEYVASRSLQDILASDGPFPPARAAEIGLGVLNALRAAHLAGVVHRDVKPGNVLIGEDGRVVLTDFGLATVPGDPNVTRTGLVLGSPAYIAPERARDGTAGPGADLWGLGATLYAAVEGASPFARPSAIATLAALATENPAPAKNAGPLKPVLNGLLRKDPTHRINIDEAERLLLRALGRKSRISFPMNPTMRRPGLGRERPMSSVPPVVPGPSTASASAPVVPGPRPPVSSGRPPAGPVPPGSTPPVYLPGKASVGKVGRPAKLDATRVDTPKVVDGAPPGDPKDTPPGGTGTAPPAPVSLAASDATKAADRTVTDRTVTDRSAVYPGAARPASAAAPASPAGDAQVRTTVDARGSAPEPVPTDRVDTPAAKPGAEGPTDNPTALAASTEARTAADAGASAGPASAGPASAGPASAGPASGARGSKGKRARKPSAPAPAATQPVTRPAATAGKPSDDDSQNSAAGGARAGGSTVDVAGATAGTTAPGKARGAGATSTTSDGANQPEGGVKQAEGGVKQAEGGANQPEGGAKQADGGAKQAGGTNRADGAEQAEASQPADGTERADAGTHPHGTEQPDASDLAAGGQQTDKVDRFGETNPTGEVGPASEASPAGDAQPAGDSKPTGGVRQQLSRAAMTTVQSTAPLAKTSGRTSRPVPGSRTAQQSEAGAAAEPALTGAAPRTAPVPVGERPAGFSRPPWQGLPVKPRSSDTTGFSALVEKVGRRRAVLLAAALGAVVVVLAVILPLALAGGEKDKSSAVRPTAGASPAVVPPAGSAAAPTASATPTETPSATSSVTPSATPTGELTLPSGWHIYRDATGFSVPVPRSWSVSHQGSEVYFREGGNGGRLLIIDQTHKPKADPVKDWKQQESQRRSGYRNYHRIAIHAVSYFQKAADWEFTYTTDSGNPQRVTKRGFVVSKKQAYGIHWSTSPGDWDANRDELAVIYQGFRPAGR
jgi:serine/threonine protein kinase